MADVEKRNPASGDVVFVKETIVADAQTAFVAPGQSMVGKEANRVPISSILA
jgi:hypothetical protein